MFHLSNRFLFWAPRALSIALIAFLSMFAMDVFGENLGFWETAQALAIHLIPSIVLIAALILAWRWEWIGATLYGAAGLLYFFWVATLSRPVPPAIRIVWVLGIAGPAFLIAALFLVNWINRRKQSTPHPPIRS